jgi:hypothetical protein
LISNLWIRLTYLPLQWRERPNTLLLRKAGTTRTLQDSLCLPTLPCIWKIWGDDTKWYFPFPEQWKQFRLNVRLHVFLLFDVLVVTYAVVELILHMLKHLFGSVNLSLWIMLNILLSRFLPGYDACLSDIQHCQSEFLQLTAGYTHQRSVEIWEAETNGYSEDWRNGLSEKVLTDIFIKATELTFPRFYFSVGKHSLYEIFYVPLQKQPSFRPYIDTIISLYLKLCYVK